MLTKCCKCNRYLIDGRWIKRVESVDETVSHGLCIPCYNEEIKKVDDVMRGNKQEEHDAGN